MWAYVYHSSVRRPCWTNRRDGLRSDEAVGRSLTITNGPVPLNTDDPGYRGRFPPHNFHQFYPVNTWDADTCDHSVDGNNFMKHNLVRYYTTEAKSDLNRVAKFKYFKAGVNRVREPYRIEMRLTGVPIWW